MTKSQRQKRFTPFFIYEHAIGAYWNQLLRIFGSAPIMVLLAEYRAQLDIITRYMLEDRFKQSEPQREQQDPLRLKQKSERQRYSVDLLAYLDMLPSPKEKELPLNILDILKFFKTLEVYILKRQ
jgi:hypothetical protein